ncbi:hypothetical protein DICA3_F05732 [Diutina catenulata]
MRAVNNGAWQVGEQDNWVVNLQYFGHSQAVVAGSTDGYLRGFSLDGQQHMAVQAHDGGVHQTTVVNDHTIGSCSTDGVKIWDLRTAQPTYHFESPNGATVHAVGAGSDGHLVGAGAELVGVDAAVYFWDLRKPNLVYREYVDSHHDDITDLKFHPTLTNYVMTGSTDGCVNVFDITEADEDESLHQVIQFASVHSCQWTLERRVAVLSHMETLGFFDLNDTNYEQGGEAPPNEMGDVRSRWPDCEYVVDLSPSGYVSYGANTQSKLTLLPFNPATEQFDEEKPVWFPEAHGEDVVRDLLVVPGSKTTITCGEDGRIKTWELPFELHRYNFVGSVSVPSPVPSPKKEKKDKKEKKEKKDKKSHKDKKHKKDKRFAPY